MHEHVRSFQRGDLPAIVRIFTDAVHELGAAHYDAAQRAAWAPQPPDLEHWATRLEGSHTLVMEADGELAGFLAYSSAGHLDLLYVSPQHARRGVASRLYHTAESQLRDAGVAELWTEASLVARPFFESHGFHVTEEQTVTRRGVSFRRFAMRKQVDHPSA